MKKILVIEDDPFIRENIIDILDEYVIYNANDGIEGIQIAKEKIPDLIISDIMLPKKDGYEVLEALRQEPLTSTIPVIFLTAKSEPSDLRKAMNLGAEDFITKPFDIEELIRIVKLRLKRKDEIDAQSKKLLKDLRSSITLSLPHEFRTPLNVIIGMTDIILSKIDLLEKEDLIEMHHHIRTSAKRLHKLIEKFLFFAKLEIISSNESEKQVLTEEASLDVKYIVEEIIQELSTDYQRNSDVEIECESINLHISSMYLGKILEEIIDNALKFSKLGNKVRIEAKKQENFYVIKISNEGIGMTPIQLKNIGAYLQFDRKLYEQSGTGLGIAIAQKLTHLHKGSFTIESDPEKKVVVTLKFPLYEGVVT
ncbi:MAG: response regulator [Leptospiraceae bacterium]|nr:response regulator [Leptospiraceae bacterium]MCP5496870.1 response regulator [Leptospiraceae bacterium]